MAGPNDLTTLENAYAWLNTTAGSNDLVIGRLITAVSNRIQTWLGYVVAQATYTRTFSGRPGTWSQGTIQRLYVPDIPLVSVSSLIIDTFPIPAGVVSGGAQQSGYYNDARSISLIGYQFTWGTNNIQATYVAGRTANDPDLAVIEQAALEWLKMDYARWSMPGIASDATSVKAGDTSISWAGAGQTTDTSKMPVPGPIYEMLQPYRRLVQVPGY